jgi:7-cyano-7-deazaguanine synthase
MQSDSVAIFSGGLDSTTLVYDMVSRGYEPHLLSFNYGQRHKKELTYAEKTSFTLGLRHDIVDLTGITHLISNSALTAVHKHEGGGLDIEVPEGHYAEDNMKLTVVPNRNMIMLSIAAGVAVNNNYKFVATGVHAGDHFVYPDCRPTFIDAANAAVVYGNEGFGQIGFSLEDGDEVPNRFIWAPFMHQSKADIAGKAFQLEVPLADTWSCYKGGETHCGRCGTCVERLEAIHQAVETIYGEKAADLGLFDPTQYADTEFWRTAKAPTA